MEAEVNRAFFFVTHVRRGAGSSTAQAALASAWPCIKQNEHARIFVAFI